MLIIACIKEVRKNSLLVQDCSTSQDIVVNTNCTRCFCVGDRIRICYNGIMTNSLPPQISATCIRRISSCCGC